MLPGAYFYLIYFFTGLVYTKQKKIPKISLKTYYLHSKFIKLEIASYR